MRLIRTSTPQPELEDFAGKPIPDYAILSHRWTDDEVSFQDMINNRKRESIGYKKVQQLCKRAAQDGFQYVWMDTCCINKESSAEISEAINSMFSWYERAGICYTYLMDVTPDDVAGRLLQSLKESEWFRRGWTLQELIAPSNMLFLASDWTDIRRKHEICSLIHDITGIDENMLRRTCQLQDFSIARKMSWAAGRECSRVEDTAYCLMGLFDVNMPLLYGEGQKAFIRFQEEIMKDSDDQTLFLWESDIRATMDPYMSPRGLLAQSPAEFKESADVVPYYFSKGGTPFAATNRGIRLHLPLIKQADNTCTIIFECQTASTPDIRLVGVKMQSIPGRDSQFLRLNHPLVRDISVSALQGAVLETVYVIKDHSGTMHPSALSFSSSTTPPSEMSDKQTNMGMSLPNVAPKDHHMQLILSFDESQNDSNIIKIHHMLHRQDSSQAHYYNPGLYGSDTDVLKDYVLGGYKFLMKQCKTEDEIFIFGSARGAYAAVYLADMIERVGLLSGNEEELAPVVWEAYQDWSRSQSTKRKREKKKQKEFLATIQGFQETVCRPAGQVKFIGLFDMIGCSRWRLHPKPVMWPCSIQSNTKCICHAVSLDEWRAELSPTLLQSMGEKHETTEIQEVWFAGSHDDIVGGLALEHGEQFSISRVPLMWIIHEAQKASLRFDQNKLTDYGFAEQDSKFLYSLYLAIETGRVHASPSPLSPSMMLFKAKHKVQHRLPMNDPSRKRWQNIRPENAVHTSVLCRMRMNNQYKPPDFVMRTGDWKWAILRNRGDPIEECYVLTLGIMDSAPPFPLEEKPLSKAM